MPQEEEMKNSDVHHHSLDSPQKKTQNTQKNRPVKEECFGCKCVAYITPFALAALVISQTREKAIHNNALVGQAAATWTGPRRWKMHFFKFNMLTLVPFIVVHSGFVLGYSYIYKRGFFRPTEECVETHSMADEVRRDLDEFKNETRYLYNGLSTRMTESCSSVRGVYQRFKNVFSGSSVDSPDDS